MTSVLKIIEKSQQKKLLIPNVRMNSPLRERRHVGDIGLEIELEGSRLPAAGYLDGIVSDETKTAWLVKNDGSLRNGGREYVLSAPCMSEEVAPLINGLFDRFAARKTSIQLSNRCSTHVHYNIGGKKINTITSIIALWTLFEEPLLKWWGDARYRNHFCLSSRDEEGTTEAWNTFLTTGRLPDARGLKYSALNLLTISTFGSLEFRGGGGVDAPEKAIQWALFIDSLCKFAERTYPSPYQIAYDLSERGAETIFKTICENCFGQDNPFFDEVTQTVEDFQECCLVSFRNVQPFVLGLPWDEWQEEFNKEYVPDPFFKQTKSEPGIRIEGTETYTFPAVTTGRITAFRENVTQARLRMENENADPI